MVNAEFEFKSLGSRSRLTISDSGIDGDRKELSNRLLCDHGNFIDIKSVQYTSTFGCVTEELSF